MTCICVACAHPIDGKERLVSAGAGQPKVYFPRDYRVPENQWRNRLPSVTASVVFPAARTTEPPTTEADMDINVNPSFQYRDNILTPRVDAEGRPNCTYGKGATYCEEISDYPRYVNVCLQ